MRIGASASDTTVFSMSSFDLFQVWLYDFAYRLTIQQDGAARD